MVERAEAFLLTARVVLPARSALERLVASLNRQALDALFTRIAARFSASTRAAFDRLLGNASEEGAEAEGDGRPTIGRFRTPSARSMGRFTRTAGERLEEVNGLLRGLPDLSDISPRVVRQLGTLCQRYDGHALRRFPAVKRYSLLACYLLERRQGLLDDMVLAHDNHMTGLMRRARRLDQGTIKALPDDAPTDFVPAGWQKALRDERGQLRRSLWETALAVAVRDALRSGDLHLPHSRQHAGARRDIEGRQRPNH